MANDLHEQPATSMPYEVVCSSADREDWLAARKSGIGASEIAAALGESHWQAAIALYASKLGIAQDSEQTEAMFWGLRLERVIAEVYAARTDRRCDWSGLMLRSREHPWALATLDALTSEDGATWWPFDSKTATVFKQGDWADGPPREYYLQAQQQMLVTGARKATLGCLLGGQRLVWCDVERDEIEIRRIIAGGRLFWEKCVQARVQPAPDGSESARQALAYLYPNAEEATVRLEQRYSDLYDELSELKASGKAIDKRVTAIENEFKAALGSADTGILPNLNAVTWRERRGGIDYKKAAESLGATPAMLEKFRRAKTRTFLQHHHADKES